MPSAHSTLRTRQSALAIAVAPIASTGSPLSHLSGAAARNGSSVQPLSPFTFVNTTAAKNSAASLESPIQLGLRRLSAPGRTISEDPLFPWLHTRSQWPFRSTTPNGNAVNSLSKILGELQNDFPHNKKLFYVCA